MTKSANKKEHFRILKPSFDLLNMENECASLLAEEIYIDHNYKFFVLANHLKPKSVSLTSRKIRVYDVPVVYIGTHSWNSSFCVSVSDY